MSKIYRVPVYYQVSEYVPVKAFSKEEAIEYVRKHQAEIPTHCGDANYIDESYEIESDPDVVLGCDEKSGLWEREVWNNEYYDATKENKDG
ncbi:hypothetical protein [Ruminococcus albus]|uniref:hypothetical protein n=1 Tax=Ruminococcus albus TaxID=1264 RepID=UPI00046756EF|nr:hypothetical protein [Ruminococcus albus]